MDQFSLAASPVLLNREMLRNREILVVDDNEMDRVLARTALEHCVANVTEAQDGSIAVDLARTHTYDLILLGIQMPILDGYRTSQVLRQELRLNTPIIAFSANALEEEKEQCLAAGMNGYLPKPFLEKDFIGLVSRLLGGERSETFQFLSAKPPVLKAEEALGEPEFDLLYIHDLGGGDAEFARKMVKAFIKEATEAFAVLPAAQERGDWPAVRAAAHKVKANLAMLNANGLYALTLEIEHLAAASNADAPALAASTSRWKLGMSQLLEKVRDLANDMDSDKA